jgi:hypothetical protein
MISPEALASLQASEFEEPVKIRHSTSETSPATNSAIIA